MGTIAVTVQILGKDYRIACEAHERQELIDSARLLDAKMREVKGGGKVVGTERVCVMAALNIAHELVQYKYADRERNHKVKSRLQGLQQRIEVALDENVQLPV